MGIYDRRMATDADIEGLRKFARSDDRGLSPYFAGRRAELDALRLRYRDLFEDWRAGNDISGRTVVVTGCPGMGKTSLLRRFEAECNVADDPTSPLAFRMPVGDLKETKSLAAALAEAAFEDGKIRGVLNALGEDVARRLQIERTLAAVKEALFRNEKKQARPVCLLVDEAQNAEPRNRDVLRKLHESDYGLPVLPVFAGLNDTEDVLRRYGISRFSNRARIPLGLLPEAEAEEAVKSLFRRCRVSGTADELARWRSTIAQDSLGFPQHLHVGMQAAADALVDANGRALAAGLERQRALAAEAREAYYRARLSPEIQAHGKALVDLVGELAMRRNLADVQELKALAFRRMQERATFGSPSEADAERFVAALIHDGVLQQNAEHTGYGVSIPSMEDWLRGDYARSLGLREAKPDNPSL